MNGRCDHEIGRIGKWHVCGRKAYYLGPYQHGGQCEYCTAHAPYGSNPLLDKDKEGIELWTPNSGIT